RILQLYGRRLGPLARDQRQRPRASDAPARLLLSVERAGRCACRHTIQRGPATVDRDRQSAVGDDDVRDVVPRPPRELAVSLSHPLSRDGGPEPREPWLEVGWHGADVRHPHPAARTARRGKVLSRRPRNAAFAAAVRSVSPQSLSRRAGLRLRAAGWGEHALTRFHPDPRLPD